MQPCDRPGARNDGGARSEQKGSVCCWPGCRNRQRNRGTSPHQARAAVNNGWDVDQIARLELVVTTLLQVSLGTVAWLVVSGRARSESPFVSAKRMRDRPRYVRLKLTLNLSRYSKA